MKRPQLNEKIITVNGTYISLDNNMDIDWKRYAHDLDEYIDYLETRRNPSLDEALNSGDGVYRP